MATLLDTDVVIHLRDGDSWVEERVADLMPPFFISAITRVELENGAARAADENFARLLDRVTEYVTTIEFGGDAIAAYRRIVRAAGYSRRKTADRMTAATAVAHNLALVTMNGRDFRDVPDLRLIAWERSD